MKRLKVLFLTDWYPTQKEPAKAAAEALAGGVPVLSTRCGGPEEFLVDDTGTLVPPGDVDALFKGLDHMLDNLHRYSRQWISQYARELFSPQCVGEKLRAVYQSLTFDAR